MNVRHLILVAALSAFAAVARADLITMNVDPNGTTSNQTLYGTVITGGVAAWPTKSSNQWRDYQFELQTTSGSTTFDAFAVQLSGQLRNQTASGNSLRATLWSGTMVTNPLLADSLVTVSTPNSSFTNGSSGYSSLLLSGSSFVPQVISTTPSIFFFRVWAEGASQNEGYQTKMAATLLEQQSVTMAPSPTIDGYIDIDSNNDGVIDANRDFIAEVPEPGTVALAAIGGLACVAWAARRRLA
jgi:hypothetical protein